MTTELILLGTCTPEANADRSSAGLMVKSMGLTLQFDAGRAAVLRMAAVDTEPRDITALFITHRHSDHISGIADVAMRAWFTARREGRASRIPIYLPKGDAAAVVARLLDAWAEEVGEQQPGRPSEILAELNEFPADDRPREVWRFGDVRVRAVAVPHGPPAAAYRIDTPDGAIVFSGDTPACSAVEELSRGAKVLVHEVCRIRLFNNAPAEQALLRAAHANTFEVGAIAKRAGIPTLVLTHFLPGPRTARHLEGFSKEVRAGGYDGNLVLGHDLMKITLD